MVMMVSMDVGKRGHFINIIVILETSDWFSGAKLGIIVRIAKLFTGFFARPPQIKDIKIRRSELIWSGLHTESVNKNFTLLS